MSKQTEERYFALVEQAVRQAVEQPTEHSKLAALSAIRRYKALMKRDYKTLWEETEGLLTEMRVEFQVLKEQLETEKRLIRKMMNEISSERLSM